MIWACDQVEILGSSVGAGEAYLIVVQNVPKRQVEKEISVYQERDYEHEERSDGRILRLDDLLV
jgi:hypothetical protein